MNKQTGGPAFPNTYRARGDQGRGEMKEWHNDGMSLRDYFAAKALPALIAPVYSDIGTNFFTEADADNRASLAYAMADAMLAARIK